MSPPTAVVPTSASTVGISGIAYGGTLRLATREAPVHFDVHFDASTALSTWGPGLEYSRLMRFTTGPDVVLPGLVVECELCERWVMEDDRTFLFELREGVRWHEGELVDDRTLNAGDVVYSYDRQRSPSGPNAGLLAAVDGVEAVGEFAVRITLAVPDADFMLGLADARSKIVAPETVAVNGDLRNGPIVGTGPWKLASFSDFAYVFERNQSYFEDGLPYADGLEVHIIPDQANRYAAFRVGQLDIVDMEPNQWQDLLDDKPDAPSLFARETGTGMELGINASREPFDDPAVRRAVFQAHDPWNAIEDIWDGAAYVSPGFPISDPSWLLERDELAAVFGNPEQAREAVRGVDRPVVIRVGNYGQSYLDHAARLAEEMRAVGFDASIEIVNQRLFGDAVWFGGDYQIFLGPVPLITTPNAYLFGTLHSAGVWNTTGLADANLDRLIEQQAVEYDTAVRRGLVQDIQRWMLDQAVRYMPATRISIWTWQQNVRGFHPNFAGFEYSHWSNVWFEGG
ncbi:MAG: ABC transporter substrate-binding protein [Chloroflexi bacterium]|nr:ABC transporter substrate-binding protein [Chloroflexota bacterium]